MSMRIINKDIGLRRPEYSDVEALYVQKNDPEVATLLGGFSLGYSREDIRAWIDRHRGIKDEVIWSIVRVDSDACLGHVGLYNIDHRVRQAEFAIMVGDKSWWGKGVGRSCTASIIDYAFDELNLNRVFLSVLGNNQRAVSLYLKMGFVEEGRLRQAQYKAGEYIDVYLMGLLREEYKGFR